MSRRWCKRWVGACDVGGRQHHSSRVGACAAAAMWAAAMWAAAMWAAAAPSYVLLHPICSAPRSTALPPCVAPLPNLPLCLSPLPALPPAGRGGAPQAEGAPPAAAAGGGVCGQRGAAGSTAVPPAAHATVTKLPVILWTATASVHEQSACAAVAGRGACLISPSPTSFLIFLLAFSLSFTPMHALDMPLPPVLLCCRCPATTTSSSFVFDQDSFNFVRLFSEAPALPCFPSLPHCRPLPHPDARLSSCLQLLLPPPSPRLIMLPCCTAQQRLL